MTQSKLIVIQSINKMMFDYFIRFPQGICLKINLNQFLGVTDTWIIYKNLGFVQLDSM